MSQKERTMWTLQALEGLHDDDHVTRLGSGRWDRVGDLRASLLRGAEANDDLAKFKPPNPYEKGLAALRAASATPRSTFEERWKEARRRDLEAERRRFEEAR
jgi:hypothetical protein